MREHRGTRARLWGWRQRGLQGPLSPGHPESWSTWAEVAVATPTGSAHTDGLFFSCSPNRGVGCQHGNEPEEVTADSGGYLRGDDLLVVGCLIAYEAPESEDGDGCLIADEAPESGEGDDLRAKECAVVVGRGAPRMVPSQLQIWL